jgi:hypothetical protein
MVFADRRAGQMDELGSSSHRFIGLYRTRPDRFAIISRYPRKPTPLLRRRSGDAAATTAARGRYNSARVSKGAQVVDVMTRLVVLRGASSAIRVDKDPSLSRRRSIAGLHQRRYPGLLATAQADQQRLR